MKALLGRSDPAVIWDRFPTYAGTLAFDVGANAGKVSEILAKGFKKVVAYEPCDDSYEALAELGPPVLPQRLAISDHTGVLTLTRTEHSDPIGELVTGDSLEFSWGRPIGEVTVPCATLDDEMLIHGIPDFVKIDTEGHEAKAVAGGTRLFSQFHPRVLIEVHSEENGKTLRSLLLDYDLERIDHPSYPADSYERDNHFWLVG